MASILHPRACQLRKNATDAEKKLWSLIRNRSIKGQKFYRQYIIEPYIVDFICREKRVIIELDGSQHAEMDAVMYDQVRTQYLEAKGYKMLRFWNQEILHDGNKILEIISQYL